MNHIIAISTYGSNRVKSRHTGKTVSAYKCGYTSSANAVLLALYGEKARDVSSKRASYHYVQIDADVTIRHGYILLKVTDDDLANTENITRKSHYSAVYRWQNGIWSAFPSLKSPDYAPVVGRSGPSFNPTGMRVVSTSTGEPESAVAGIIVEKSQHDPNKKAWWWLSGDTFPHRDTLKRWGGRWSKRQKRWYFIADDLPQAVQDLIETVNTPDESPSDEDAHDPCTIEEASAILGVTIAEKPSDEPQIEEETPAIRVIKPVLADDDSDPITTAVRQTHAEKLPVMQSINTSRHAFAQIPQSSCGELTGSITGNVWCYGWAIHDGVCVYVNCGGPRMAVEAIRAKLAKGDIVSCVPWDAPSIELTAGEGETGKYTAFMQNIPEAKFTSLILCHEWLTVPNYGGKSTTFMFEIDQQQAMSQLRHHVTKLVKVPVFPAWTGYLWQAGQSAMLVRPTRTGGDVKLWTVDLDADAWTRLITGGLSVGLINLSDHTSIVVSATL